MSYDGRLGFGLLGDYDALADLDTLADMLRTSIDALADSASVPRRAARGARSRAPSAASAPAPRRPAAGHALMAGKAFAALATVVLTVLLVAGARGVLRLARRRDGAAHRASGPGEARAGRRRARGRARQRRAAAQRRAPDARAARGSRERIAGPPDPALQAAGQAVLVQQRPNLRVPVTAVTATRSSRPTGPDDPALEAFIEYWLARADERSAARSRSRR